MVTDKGSNTQELGYGKVKKPNQLIQADQKITTIQAKVIFGMLAEFKFHATLDRSKDRLDTLSERIYEIPISALVADFKKSKGGSIYTRVREQLKEAMAFSLDVEDANGGVMMYNLVSFSHLEKGSSTIKAKFNRDVIPTLVNMVENGYTEIPFVEIQPLKSIYAIRIYELLLKNMNLSHVINKGYILELPKLRSLLGIEKNAYKLFGDINRRVLQQAHKEITTMTSLRYEYEPMKEGRKVVAIRFFDITLVSTFKDEAGILLAGAEQTELFSKEDPLSMLQPRSAREIRKKHSRTYIDHYYQVACSANKKGRVKSTLANLFFGLLTKDPDNFYDMEKLAKAEAKREKEALAARAKEEKRAKVAEERATKAYEELFADAEARFDALTSAEQDEFLDRMKKENPILPEGKILREQTIMTYMMG